MRLGMKKLRFAYPEAIVYLAAIVNHMLSRSNALIREEKPEWVVADEYLKECGLRSFFYVRRNEARAVDPKFFDDCIPISRDHQDKVSIAAKLANLIATRLHMDLDTKTLLSEALGEIMGNALEHSEVAHWYRIGQIHPTRRHITVAIADNGVGVPYTLRNGYLRNTFRKVKDASILEASFSPLVTRHPPRKGEAHGGGLDTVWAFAKETKSKLGILSGSGIFQVDFNIGDGDEAKKYTKLPSELPGTLLVLRIPF